MKAEHRKELETNKLADKIGQTIQSFKEGPSRNAIIYGSVVAVAVLLFVVYRWVSANASATASARWMAWDQLSTREDAERFAKDNVDNEQGRLARFELARLDLVSGVTKLDNTFQKADAIKELRRSADAYKKLADESGNAPLLAQEALMNAGKAHESLGEYDKAKELYGKLARDYPQSINGKNAAEQVKALEADSAVLDELKTLAIEPPSTPLSSPLPNQ
jgi:tetratricopeptide (TPR) repeat protein